MADAINLDSKNYYFINKTSSKTVYYIKNGLNQSKELIKIYNISRVDKISIEKYMRCKILIHPNILISYNKIQNSYIFITRNYLFPTELYLRNRNVDKYSFVCDICNAVEHLHINQTVHGNISLNNIMVDVHTNNVLLVDIYQYLLLPKEFILQFYSSSFYNISPEILKCQNLNQNTVETDIWSLGCVIFEIFSGYPPFYKKDILSLYKNINKCNYNIEYIERMNNPEISEMLKKIFQTNPAVRPSISEICKIINKHKITPICSYNKSIVIKSESVKIYSNHSPDFPSYIFNNNSYHSVPSIKHLSNELKYYTSLIELKLENCVNNKSLKYVSNMFYLIPALQILSFEYEIERDIDKEINYNYGNQLSFESVSCFSKNTRFIPNLQHLNLNNNSIDDYSASLIFKNLSFNTNLKSLHLKSNFINILSLTEFNKVVSCLNSLEYLDLSNTNITTTEITVLSQIIKQIKTLKYLNLSDSLIGNNYNQLYQSISYCSNLTCLKLKNCYIDNMSLQSLSNCFIHFPLLETLTLEYNYFNENSFNSLVSHLSCITNLKSFNFSANPLKEECYRLFGDNMKFITKLEKLKLAGTEIGNKGIKYISDNFKYTPNLYYLNLNFDYYNDDGLISLSNSFSYITNLKVLLIRSNSFSSTGITVFSNNLKYITQLEILNIAETMTNGSNCLNELNKNIDYISNLKHLNLSSNHIGKLGIISLCRRWTNLTKLETLSLESNKITKDCRDELTYFIGKLKRLKHFNLSDNAINSIDLRTTNQLRIIQYENNKKSSNFINFFNDVSSLSNHRNMVHINLSGNRIDDNCYTNYRINHGGIKWSFDYLKTIGFYGNDINVLYNFTNFHKLCNLQKLGFEKVKINSYEMLVEFSYIFRYIPHLQYLNLSSNSLIDGHIKGLLYNIRYISNLEELSLKNNRITCIGLCDISDHFSELRNLKTFDISFNKLTANSVDYVNNIVNNLSFITRLKDLNVSNCRLEDSSNMDILSDYFGYLNRITILRMNTNCFSKNTVRFYENIRLLSTLHTLELNDVGCDDACLITFSKNFSRLNYLNELSLTKNNISSIGIVEMAKHLSHLSLLTSISLSGNKISDEGIISLSNELSTVTNLINIYIDDINMTNVGMKCFSTSLKYLPHLNTLNIEENQIYNDGFIEFCHNCKYICNLENLYCYNNNIGDNGIVEFSKFMSNLYNLKIINMSGNKINNGIKSFSEQLKHTPNIKSLDLSSNNISNNGILSLCNHLSVLKYLNKLCIEDNNYEENLDWFKNIKKNNPNLVIK